MASITDDMDNMEVKTVIPAEMKMKIIPMATDRMTARTLVMVTNMQAIIMEVKKVITRIVMVDKAIAMEAIAGMEDTAVKAEIMRVMVEAVV